MKFFAFAVLSGFLIASSAFGARVWSDVTEQFVVEADFVEADGATVSLRAVDGRLLRVPLRDLSKNDYEWVAEHLRQKGVQSITAPREFPPLKMEDPFANAAPEGRAPMVDSPYPDYYAIVLDPERFSTDIIREMSTVIPDGSKKSWHFPALLIGGGVLWFFASVWFLLAVFSQSPSWGFAQLLADLVSLILILPGILCATAFVWKNWSEAKSAYLFKLIAFLAITAAPFFIPSDAVPPPPSIF